LERNKIKAWRHVPLPSLGVPPGSKSLNLVPFFEGRLKVRTLYHMLPEGAVLTRYRADALNEVSQAGGA